MNVKLKKNSATMGNFSYLISEFTRDSWKKFEK